MKLSLILFFAFSLQLSASVLLGQQVSIRVGEASLKSVLVELKEQTGTYFMYNENDMDASILVDLDMQGASLEEALEEICKQAPFTYEIIEDFVVFAKKTPVKVKEEVKQEKKEIKGKVTDEYGETLPGVSVVVKGTTYGVSTDIDGNYTLIMPEMGGVLVFSFVGMESQEVQLKNQQTIDVVLKSDQSQLNEVVVTGYQTLSKERATGSFAKADMGVVQTRSTGGNVLKALEGLIPGLTVNNDPNARYNPLLIRGLTTIGTINSRGQSAGAGTNRSPLFVVDGIAVQDVSQIDPQDVESIQVLKDATAASIWGARAANGVIVITTKQGKASDGIKVEYDGFVNFSGMPDLDYKKMLTSRQYIDAAIEYFDPSLISYNTASRYTNMGTSPLPPHYEYIYQAHEGLISAEERDSQLDRLAALDNRGQIRDLLYRNASTMNHTVAFSGGSKKHNFYASLAYKDVKDNRPDNKDNTYNVNLRQSFKFNDRIGFDLITNISNHVMTGKRPQTYIKNNYFPYMMLRDEAGNNLTSNYNYHNHLSDAVREDFEARSRVNLDYYPLDEMNYGKSKSNTLNARLSGVLNIKLIDGLDFKGTYGYTSSRNRSTSFDSQKSFRVRANIAQFAVANTVDDDPVYNYPSSGGRYQVNNSLTTNWTIRNQLNFDKTWNDIHQLTAMVGIEALEQKTVTNQTLAYGFDPLLLTTPTLDWRTYVDGMKGSVWYGTGGTSRIRDVPFLEKEVLRRFNSYYANIAYTFNEKYSFNGSWRVDGSNLFGTDKAAQSKPVWSAGAKWLMHKEDFMQGLDWLDRLSLRGTIGITGNAPTPGTAASQDLLNARNSSRVHTGYLMSIATVGNKSLSWESTEITNLGVDFSVLGKLNGSIEVYSKKTTDMLGNIPTNSLTGYTDVLGNIGDMENKGIELSLNANILDVNDFSWSSSFVFGYNKNKITKLKFGAPPTSGYYQRIRNFEEGYPAMTLFAYNYAGLDEEGLPLVKLADGTTTTNRSATKPEDIKYMGTMQPKYSGGFSNVFSYKNLSLSTSMSFNFGHVMKKPNDYTFKYGLFNRNMVADEWLNRWQKPGDEKFTDIPKFITGRNNAIYTRNLSYYINGHTNVLDASYVKLSEMTLSYQLPKKLTSKINVSNVKFRCSLNNVLLWKANKAGVDPEFQQNMPSGRNNVTLGLHVTF